MPHRVHDARRRGLHAPRHRAYARSGGRNIEDAAQTRAGIASRRACRIRRGMETMKNFDNDDIDFGADDGSAHPVDPAFDTWIAGMAPSLNSPPRVPRDEMWAEIHAARRTHLDAQQGRIAGVTPLRRSHWP